MRCGARFAEAVTLLDGDFEPFVDCLDEFLGQGRGTAVHHAEGAEVVFVGYGMLGEEEDDGGNDVGEGYAVLLDGGAELFDFESGHDDEVEAAVHTLVDETSKSWGILAELAKQFRRGSVVP